MPYNMNIHLKVEFINNLHRILLESTLIIHITYNLLIIMRFWNLFHIIILFLYTILANDISSGIIMFFDGSKLCRLHINGFI